MGIEKINAYLKKNHPEVFTQIKIEELNGTFLPIDSDFFLKKNLSGIIATETAKLKDVTEDLDRKKLMGNIIRNGLNLSIKFLKHGVTPIWIRDGEIPIEKREEINKRREQKTKDYEMYENLREKLRSTKKILRDPEEVSRCRDLAARCNRFTREEREDFYDAIFSFGLPVIKAPGETEAYCCSFVLAKLAKGVYTTDTDCYAMGASIFPSSNGINEDGEELLSFTSVKAIRKALKLTQEELTELCIMLGCDFNTTIHGKGMVACLKLIREHSNIESMTSIKDKSACYNVERCRELFTPPSCPYNKDSSDLKLNTKRFKQFAADLSISLELSAQYNKLTLLMPPISKFTIVFDDNEGAPIVYVPKIKKVEGPIQLE